MKLFRVMMTESYSDEDKLFPYYGNGTHNGAHFAFNFWFITRLNKDSNANDIKNVVDNWFSHMAEHDTANWVVRKFNYFNFKTLSLDI